MTTLREEKLLGGNRVLTQKIAQLRESAQRQWESLHHYVETRTEEQPCGFCGAWGEHDNDSCDLVAVVTALEEDFGCGEHWRGETIAVEDAPSADPADIGHRLTLAFHTVLDQFVPVSDSRFNGWWLLDGDAQEAFTGIRPGSQA